MNTKGKRSVLYLQRVTTPQQDKLDADRIKRSSAEKDMGIGVNNMNQQHVLAAKAAHSTPGCISKSVASRLKLPNGKVQRRRCQTLKRCTSKVQEETREILVHIRKKKFLTGKAMDRENRLLREVVDSSSLEVFSWTSLK